MRATDLLRYARVHRAGAVLVGVMAVAILSALFGGTRIALPSIGSIGVSTGIPYRQELPLLSAVFLTAVLGGAMAAHEEAGAPRVHRVRAVCLAVLTVATCVFSFVTESLAVGPGAGLVYVRSTLIWLGLALVSVRLFGHQLGWAVPLASALPLTWFSQEWWDWTANPAEDFFSWTLAALSLSLGSAAIAATRWRMYTFRSARGAWPAPVA
ncbi:hypothetical protein [Streptomyces formicae]|uniref:Integral membrane protein n=2 Tax=Streptomyces formicae TaxID=1616117 RepID=A0ABY3WUV9_9ACTN|nr:hypothetical protein J4032_10675 [Streptomyces formicae]